MEIYDYNNNLIQTISIEPDYHSSLDRYFFSPSWIRADDLNGDGYMDILLNRGDERYPQHDLYIWDTTLSEFVKVDFIGFDSIMFHNVYEGYVLNMSRTADYYIVETLVWEGTALVKISEERHEFW
jgi:hypothetical protein